MAKNLLSIIIVVLFGIIAGFPFLHEGLIPTHDAEYHIIRFFLFNESFNDGNLYPRWTAHLNNGFGVPLFTFVYPLPNYIAVFLHSLNISFIDSFRFEMFAAIIIGAIFLYLWAKEFWGRLGGIVSSVFYTFSPYHFVDTYIRGSIGEVWALAFFPAFLWAYVKFIKTRQKTFLMLSSIFLASIIFSHNILALMFFLFALSYIIFSISREKNKKYLVLNTLLIILLALGLSAIFWLPAIYETRFVTGLQIFDVTSHFPDLYQLLIPTWGSGFSAAGLQNEISFQIGIANLIVIFLSALITMALIIRRKKLNLHVVFFLMWFFFVLFLMLDISKAVWKTVPLLNYFQFPWRLLSIEILFAAFLAGGVISVTRNRIFKITISAILIFLAFVLGIGYIKPAYYHYRNDNYYITRPNFIDGTNSPGNVFNTIFLNSIPDKKKEKLEFVKGKGKISVVDSKSNLHKFKIDTDKDSEIIVNIAYYPGWEVYINGKKVDVSPTKNGRFTFLLPSGENNVKIIFNDTFVRSFSAFISFLSLLLVIALFKVKRFVTISK